MMKPMATISTDLITRRLHGSVTAIQSLQDQTGAIASMVDLIIERLREGGTLYTCGNGGSAAEALHLAEELIGRYSGNRAALRAICLNADPTALTCIANDFGYDQVFARQCEALLKPEDVLLVLSTSGNSPNIIEALRTGKRAGAPCLGLLGRDGGASLALCDQAIVVPAQDSAHVQEAHQVLIHLICELVEHAFR
jgi:D-sedoheptulose 7-phosphate isomerase